jgi:hypothetical protein
MSASKTMCSFTLIKVNFTDEFHQNIADKVKILIKFPSSDMEFEYLKIKKTKMLNKIIQCIFWLELERIISL